MSVERPSCVVPDVPEPDWEKYDDAIGEVYDYFSEHGLGAEAHMIKSALDVAWNATKPIDYTADPFAREKTLLACVSYLLWMIPQTRDDLPEEIIAACEDAQAATGQFLRFSSDPEDGASAQTKPRLPVVEVAFRVPSARYKELADHLAKIGITPMALQVE